MAGGSAQLSLARSSLSLCVAGGQGGGLAGADFSRVVLEEAVHVRENVAGSRGGGVLVSGAALEVRGAGLLVTGNTAGKTLASISHSLTLFFSSSLPHFSLLTWVGSTSPLSLSLTDTLALSLTLSLFLSLSRTHTRIETAPRTHAHTHMLSD
eukprot:2641336-Rhodomonas_salina.1